MAGTISLSDDVRWSATGWLFDWVLRTIAAQSQDEQLAAEITEVIDENIGWFGLDDLTAGQRAVVQRIIRESLLDIADRELPRTVPSRPQALALIAELAAKLPAAGE